MALEGRDSSDLINAVQFLRRLLAELSAETVGRAINRRAHKIAIGETASISYSSRSTPAAMFGISRTL